MAETDMVKKIFQLEEIMYDFNKYVNAVGANYKDKSQINCSSDFAILPRFRIGSSGGKESCYVRIEGGKIYKVDKPCFIYCEHYRYKWDDTWEKGFEVFIGNNSSMNDKVECLINTNASNTNNMFLISPRSTTSSYICVFGSGSGSGSRLFFVRSFGAQLPTETGGTTTINFLNGKIKNDADKVSTFKDIFKPETQRLSISIKE